MLNQQVVGRGDPLAEQLLLVLQELLRKFCRRRPVLADEAVKKRGFEQAASWGRRGVVQAILHGLLQRCGIELEAVKAGIKNNHFVVRQNPVQQGGGQGQAGVLPAGSADPTAGGQLRGCLGEARGKGGRIVNPVE